MRSCVPCNQRGPNLSSQIWAILSVDRPDARALFIAENGKADRPRDMVLSNLGLYDSKGQELDRTKIADFQRFNSILGGSIDRVQKEVIERYDRRAWVSNASTRRGDERLGARAVERAREHALDDARALSAGEAPRECEARFSRFLTRLSLVTEPVRTAVMLTRRPDSRIWP